MRRSWNGLDPNFVANDLVDYRFVKSSLERFPEWTQDPSVDKATHSSVRKFLPYDVGVFREIARRNSRGVKQLVLALRRLWPASPSCLPSGGLRA